MAIGAAILGVEGTRLTQWERDFLRDFNPFGMILFARNIQTPDQVSALTAEMRSVLGRDIFILIDQEGGRVQRLRAPYWREWTPPLDMVARAGPHAGRAMELRSTLIAHELRSLGIDANCAPIADIAGPQTHPFLHNRCYGQDPSSVTQIAAIVADAFLAAGVMPVIKHIPGHGRSGADTHHDLPRVATPLAQLQTTDFAPFRALAHLPMAMTAHIIFDAIDPQHPATQSAAVIRMIRDWIGFEGLLMTDDLNMQALSGDMRQRTERALAAGCDLALQCNGQAPDMQAVAMAAPQLTPTAQARATAAEKDRKSPPPVDIAALEAEFSSIMGDHRHD
jgi:beta-N-acetylhexosaminidase